MIKHVTFSCLVFLLSLSCSEESEKKTTPSQKPASAVSASSSNQTAKVPSKHFFSVAWGCVEVETAKLEAAAYQIQDYQLIDGACPATLTVLATESKPLFDCPVTIGPKLISAVYILYDKRTIDGKTISDLRAEGFTEDNFCPAVAQKVLK